MKAIIVLSLGMFCLAGCTQTVTPARAGTHNLSKGKCVDVPCRDAQCRRDLVDEEVTQTHCEIMGGQFVPREIKKRIWL